MYGRLSSGDRYPGFYKGGPRWRYGGGRLDDQGQKQPPGICGRVCPQEVQCESRCVLGKKGAPIAIGRLERFVATWESKNALPEGSRSSAKPPRGKRVAVVGAGPAGITAAADLARMGHQVTVFEALHDAGGVLIYGIPEFRLPKEIVRSEVEYVKSLGSPSSSIGGGEARPGR
jgi:glutamate synthase (NADPH/NADH) small chain